MALSRYSVIDEYTLEELRREFQNSDVAGRIRLLERFPKADDEYDYKTALLPVAIIRMAAEDDHAAVRQWIARHGRFLQDSLTSVVERLISDPDPFVRACLMENRTHVDWTNAERAFLFATHLERLALVRNPEMAGADKVIRKIFDLEEQDGGPRDKLGRLEELGINFEQRKELALAFVSNPEAQKDSCRDLCNDPDLRVDAFAYFAIRERWSTVWKLAAKWPFDSGVPRAVFENIGTDDEVKAEVYRDCKEARSRSSILNGCSPRDQETTKLGASDPDGTCRFTACEKIQWVNLGPTTLDAILSNGDKDSLMGLSFNESLPLEILERVAEKFKTLGDYLQESIAKRTIKRVREKQEQAMPGATESDSELTSDLFKAQSRLISSLSDAEHEFVSKGLDAQSELISRLFNAQEDYLTKLFRAQADDMTELSVTPTLFNRKLLILVLIVTGIGFLLGAPLSLGLGIGTIGLALIFIFAPSWKRAGKSKAGK